MADMTSAASSASNPLQPLRPMTPWQRSAILAGLLANGIAMTMMFAVVPTLARSLGLSEVLVAVILTASSILYTITTPYWAKLADIWGRKPVFVFSILANAATNIGFAILLGLALSGHFTSMEAFIWLCVARAAFGLLTPGLFPASMAMTAEASTPINRTKVMAQNNAAMGIGSILGPAIIMLNPPIAALLNTAFGGGDGFIPSTHIPLLTFWISSGFSAFIGVYALFTLPRLKSVKTRKELQKENPPKGQTLKALFDPRVTPFMIIAFGYFMAMTFYNQTISYQMEDRFGLAPEEAPNYVAIVAIAGSIAALATQLLYVPTWKKSPNIYLLGGVILAGIGYSIALFHPFMALASASVICGVGGSILMASNGASSTLNVEPEEQMIPAAGLGVAPPAAFAVGPILAGALYAWSPNAPFIAAIMICTLMVPMALKITRTPLKYGVEDAREATQ